MSAKNLAPRGHGSWTPHAPLRRFFAGASQEIPRKRSLRRSMRRFAGNFLLASLAVAASPRHDAHAATEQMDFAHWRPEMTQGGPVGRLLALQMGFTADFSTVAVCVETGHPTMPDADAVFEAKLAYAAWLKAAGRVNESAWRRLSFVPQSECRPESRWGAFVSYGNPRVTRAAGVMSDFQEARLSCQAQNGSRGCRMNGLTLGYGGPGIMTSFATADESRKTWARLASSRPSITYLSHRVDWVSLESDLMAKPTQAMAMPVRDSLLRTLRGLRAQSAPSLESLASFMAALKSARAIANPDPVFQRLTSEFYRSGQSALDRTYRPRFTAFHTVLHEVGHQMGMDHADAPDANSTTGQATGASRNTRGQWVNSHSSMAYGDHYLYLTDDDEAGSRSNARAIEAMLTSHR